MSSKRQQPVSNQAPVVQWLCLRYAKRGVLRFASHRDFARALERAIRRAGIPVAYSQGFSPHPKISYASAAPTGAASLAEYLELGLREPMAAAALREALDDALPVGLDILDVVEAPRRGLADRLTASAWRVELPGLPTEPVARAVERFLAAPEVLVRRMAKNGVRTLDARDPVVRLAVSGRADETPSGVGGLPCAILDLVVRHVTPTVRPDDVLAGLRAVADLESSEPPRAVRLAQGVLTAEGEVADPLVVDGDLAGSRTISG